MTDAEQRDPLRAIFRECGEQRRVRRGDRLHAAGRPPQYIYLLEAGWIGRSRVNAAGEAAFTAVHIAGDLVGADAIGGGALADDLFALTNASVLRVATDILRARVSRDPDAAIILVDLLAADAGYLREALLALGRQSSPERLSTFILQTYHRLVAAGLLPSGATRFELPLTQAQMAAVTGMTGVHVNRVLRMLREARYLDVRGGVVRIDDMAALEREAQKRTLSLHRDAERV